MSGHSRRFRLRCALLAGVSALAALGVATPSWRELSVPLGAGGRLEVGRISLERSLVGAALAQDAGVVTLENVIVDLGSLVYRLPRAEFSGVNLSRDELLALFDAKASEPVAARLARFSAREVRIPELVVEQTLAGERQVTVYKQTVARDVVNGRIASLTSESGTIAGRGKDGPRSGSYGRSTITEFDLGEAARIFAEPGTDAENRPEMKRIYAGFSLENLVLTDGTRSEAKVAAISGRDFFARKAGTSWADMMRAVEVLQPGDKASPAEVARLMKVSAEISDAVRIGSIEATGIEVRDPKAKDGGSARLARLGYTGGASSEARIEGFEVMSDTGRFQIGSIAFTGFSFQSTIDVLKGLGDRTLESLDAAEKRRLIPTIGTVHLSGLDFDLPKAQEGAKPAAKAQNIKFSVKDVEVTADRPLNGVPTNARVAVDRLSFPVPANPEEDGLKELVGLGYRAVDASFAAATNWNEPASELLVRELSLRSADMGAISLKGTLGNVSKDVFSADPTVAAVALVGAAARTIDLTVENGGLFERLVAREAKKQKKSPDDLRREYGVAAAVAIPAMLGSSAQAKSLGQAVARFIAKPGRLSVSARAKDAAGLGIADIVSLGEPAAILDKLDVTATAE